MTDYVLDEQGMLDQMDKDAQRRQELATQYSGAGTKYFKIPLNEYSTFRLLPRPASYEGSKIPFVKIVRHFLPDGEGGKMAVNCTLDMHGSCPICRQVEALKASARMQSDTSAKDKYYRDASALRANETYSWTVLGLSKDSGTWELGVLSLPAKAHDMLNEIYKMKKVAAGATYISPLDLQKGKNVIIFRKKVPKAGTTFHENIYNIQFADESTAVDPVFLENYAENYIYPEKIDLDYKPEDLDRFLKGDFSTTRKNQQQNAQPHAKPAPASVSTPLYPTAQEAAPAPVQAPPVETPAATQTPVTPVAAPVTPTQAPVQAAAPAPTAPAPVSDVAQNVSQTIDDILNKTE